MPRIALVGGAYQSRSVIASAQRSLNLYGEPMPQNQGEAAPVAHYPTPGLTVLGTLPQSGVRGIKQATTGGIYAVAGNGVYLVDPTAWTGTLLGNISGLRPYPVSMQDNGNTLVIVDGTAGGWTVDLPSHAFAAISDPAFYGADRVDYLDTYLLFNKPNTPQFYSSDSLATTFDSLWFANKESYSDLLVSLAVAKREIWLIGERTTEVWYNSGASDFPFEQIQGTFVDHGCRAKYSVAVYDDAVYWLSYDRAGQGIVLHGAGYTVQRVSTFAIEQELTTYPTISDAIGFVYSLGGHAVYVLTFPTADHTWCYDLTTQQWHEWCWIDNNGAEHRHRANCCYPCNGTVVVGDWQNGNLYALDGAVYTDNGQPIKRQRAFPHITQEFSRVFYREFLADLETGNAVPEASSTVVTLASSTFTAANNTLLESYAVAGETTWTLASGTSAEIENDQLAGPAAGGASLYQSPALTQADYTVQFQAIPNNYAAVSHEALYAFGRATGPGTGYYAQVSGDGTQYWITAGTAGGSSTAIAMGTLTSGSYTVVMQLLGDAVNVSVQRSQDSAWLTTTGVWSSSFGYCIAFTDSTYAGPGMVMIGGNW